MAVTKTPRFSLPQWSAGTDPYPGRVGFNEIHQLLEDQAAVVFPSGPVAARPRSGTFGRFFLATDQGSGGRLYYDGGSGWIELNTNGGGGAGQAVVIGGAGSEGSSDRSARSDHTHPLPMATAANHGAMASQHYALLDKATMQATAATLVLRDNTGRITCAAPNPSVTGNVVTIGYLNGVIANLGDYRAIPGELVRRYDNGHFRLPSTGFGIDDAVSKRYVDSRTSRAGWKENIRQMPYGLDHLRRVTPLVFDYTAAAPEDDHDVLGAFVENVAAVMPLLTIDGEDQAPERIKDRELIWVAVQAIRELATANDDLRAEITALREDLGLA